MRKTIQFLKKRSLRSRDCLQQYEMKYTEENCSSFDCKWIVYDDSLQNYFDRLKREIDEKYP